VRRTRDKIETREPRVTAIVVTYRSRETIAETLRIAHEAHEAGLLDCVVVDNAGGDGTVEYIRAEHPWVEVIANAKNLGFGRACNVALGCVHTPYTLLLNPDATLALDALAVMVRFLDSERKAGIVGPAILAPDGSLAFARAPVTPLKVLLRAAARPKGHADHRVITPGGAPFRADWLSGAILLVRSSLLETLGGFDRRFFLYFEDDDLYRRALARGWEVWALGEAVGYHMIGASARATQSRLHDTAIADHFFRSRFYYLVKYHGWLAPPVWRSANS
jgi:GT2 family glycosyltransferase